MTSLLNQLQGLIEKPYFCRKSLASIIWKKANEQEQKHFYSGASYPERLNNLKLLYNLKVLPAIQYCILNSLPDFKKYFCGLSIGEGRNSHQLNIEKVSDNLRDVLLSGNISSIKIVVKFIQKYNSNVLPYFYGVRYGDNPSEEQLLELSSNFRAALSSHNKQVIEGIWGSSEQFKGYYCGRHLNLALGAGGYTEEQKEGLDWLSSNFRAALSGKISKAMGNELFSKIPKELKLYLGGSPVCFCNFLQENHTRTSIPNYPIYMQISKKEVQLILSAMIGTFGNYIGTDLLQEYLKYFNVNWTDVLITQESKTKSVKAKSILSSKISELRGRRDKKTNFREFVRNFHAQPDASNLYRRLCIQGNEGRMEEDVVVHPEDSVTVRRTGGGRAVAVTPPSLGGQGSHGGDNGTDSPTGSRLLQPNGAVSGVAHQAALPIGFAGAPIGMPAMMQGGIGYQNGMVPGVAHQAALPIGFAGAPMGMPRDMSAMRQGGFGDPRRHQAQGGRLSRGDIEDGQR